MPKTIKRNRRAGIRSRKIHQRGGRWPWNKKSSKKTQEEQPLLSESGNESGANPEFNPEMINNTNPNPNTHANVSANVEKPGYLEILPKSNISTSENNKSIVDYPYMVVSENNIKTYKDSNNNEHYYLGTNDKRVIITKHNQIIPVYKFTVDNDNFYLVETKLYNETAEYYTQIKQTFSKKKRTNFFEQLKNLPITALALYIGAGAAVIAAGMILVPYSPLIVTAGSMMISMRYIRHSIYTFNNQKFKELTAKFINYVHSNIDTMDLTKKEIQDGLEQILKFNDEIIKYETKKIDPSTLESIKRFISRPSGIKNERRIPEYRTRLRNVHEKLTK